MTARLRVLHTESSLGWGGQENRTLNEMVVLRELGQFACVLTQPGAKLAQRAEELGIPVFTVPMRHVLDVQALWAIRKIIQRERIDIVNTHSGRDTQLAALSARSLFSRRPRIVRTRHLALPITSRWTYSILPDRVVTVSRFVAAALEASGIPADKISTVLTGIELEPYGRANPHPHLKAELGLPSEALLVGCVAILRRKKGHAELLEAIPEIIRQFPQAYFVFVGNGPQYEPLRLRIAALGLQDRVFLLGLRRDVVEILSALDVFVLPTHQEALGTAYIEAGAMGLACVASRIDGVPEVVLDGQTGLLVPPKDSAALAAAVCTLLADPQRRALMGQAARQRVRHLFARETMGREMLALYRALLESL